MIDFLLPPNLFCEEHLPQPASTSTTNALSRAAVKVETLSRHFLDKLNDQEYYDKDLIDHIADDFHGKHDQLPPANTYAELVQLHRQVAERYPDVHHHVIDISVQVYDRHTRVLAFMLTTGYPDRIRRQTMSVFKWQRRQGRWMLRQIHSTGSVYPGSARLFEERALVRSRLPEFLSHLAREEDDVMEDDSNEEDEDGDGCEGKEYNDNKINNVDMGNEEDRVKEH